VGTIKKRIKTRIEMVKKTSQLKNIGNSKTAVVLGSISFGKTCEDQNLVGFFMGPKKC
jgi:hypothetical protein